MLYKMDVSEMKMSLISLTSSVTDCEEIYSNSVNFVNKFHHLRNTDAKLGQYFEEALGYMRDFRKYKEELSELHNIFNACIRETVNAENGVEKYIEKMFEEAKKNEVSTLSKYDAYLYNRKEYDKNYDMWSDKNFNALSVVGASINSALDETKNMLSSMWDTITGKNMVTEIEAGYIKEIIHSAIQKECQHREHKVLSGGYEDFVDSIYDGKDVIDYGFDLSELYLSEKLSESQMKELSKLTGIGLDELGKFMKYGEKGVEYIEYLMNDYSENLKYLESLETAFSQVENPAVVEQVISELKRKYSDKFFETADMVMEDIKDYAGDKAMKAILKLTPGTKALSAVIDGFDLVLDATDAKDNLDNWSAIIYHNNEFQPTMDAAIDNYLEKYNNGTASMQDIETLNTLIDIDNSIKEIMYEKMSVENEGFAEDFANASELLQS